MAEHHALGSPGGAGAVDHHPWVVLGYVRVLIGRFGARDESLVLVVVATDDDHIGDVGELVADRGDRRHELGTDEQHGRARVVDHVVELVAGESPVHDGAGRSVRPAPISTSRHAGWFLSRNATRAPSPIPTW